MPNNQLAVIVKESGLAPAKAKTILTQFQNYFDIAADWETKAKSIKVINETQTAEMEMARTGRLFLSVFEQKKKEETTQDVEWPND